MSRLILTCDAGTTGCKASVFDETCTLIASHTEPYDTLYPHPNWAEQDMNVIWNAVKLCIRTLTGRVGAENIAVVGLSGTMNGVVPVDAQGNTLYNNIIHSDSRAWQEVDEIRSVISEDDFYKLTGCRPDHHYMLPKLLWLRKNAPDVYSRAALFLNTKDFIHGRLTGNYDSTDYSDAGLTIAEDINNACWSADLLRELKLDLSRMPAIRCGYDIRDTVSTEAAGETGLLQGTPVAVGGGDGSCTARGAGLHNVGDAYCYIGSSAWISQLTDRPLPDAQRRLFHYLDMDGKSVLSCGTVQCGAAAYNWSLDNLLQGRDFGKVEQMATEIAPGSEGVLFLPTLMGERTPYWDPNTRGALIGFSLYHDRRHIARAVYEGVAFALATTAYIMRDCGYSVRSLMLAGGGAHSKLWPQLLASLCGVETHVHVTPADGTSLGAAIAAGIGAGIFRDYADGTRHVHASAAYQPDTEQQKRYGQVYPVYAGIYDRLKPLFDTISTL